MNEVFEPRPPRIGSCPICHRDSVKLYEFEDGEFCSDCATGKDIHVGKQHIAKPDSWEYMAIEQPNGDTLITDGVSAQMTCKCKKAMVYLHAGQISPLCPYCRRQWLATHNRKTGRFSFIQYNSWWRKLYYRVIGRGSI